MNHIPIRNERFKYVTYVSKRITSTGVNMVSITLSVPKEFKQKMDEFEWLNWSSIAREAFAKRMKQLEILEGLDELFKNSELTDEDCIKLGRQLKKDMFKRLKQEGKL